MKARFIGETQPLMLTKGKIYSVLSVERRYYRVEDDTGDDYLYPPTMFEIVSDEQ